MNTHIELMQKVVDVVTQSEHPTNKIAAGLLMQNGSFVTNTNERPERIRENFDISECFGGASGWVHAETFCILKAQNTDVASIYITDPFCPNCAKNIAEAGIKTIFIDHKGFAKDFSKRRGEEFENMSMRICDAAGISVYELHRKEGWIIPILVHDQRKRVQKAEHPIEVQKIKVLKEAAFLDFVHEFIKGKDQSTPLAIGCGVTQDSEPVSIIAPQSLSIGWDKDDNQKHNEEKYSFISEPCNRLLMNAARLGIELDKRFMFSSRTPRPREQINLIGAEYQIIYIENTDEGDASQGQKANQKLKTLLALNKFSETVIK